MASNDGNILLTFQYSSDGVTFTSRAIEVSNYFFRPVPFEFNKLEKQASLRIDVDIRERWSIRLDVYEGELDTEADTAHATLLWLENFNAGNFKRIQTGTYAPDGITAFQTANTIDLYGIGELEKSNGGIYQFGITLTSAEEKL